MCGITAISANKEALPFLLQGLEKLEYRIPDRNMAVLTLLLDL